MLMPFDWLAVAALMFVVVVSSMRLLYGAWPWEAGKTWYRTRQAVGYVAKMRRANREPTLRRLVSAENTANDSFDRSLMVHDNSPLEAAPQHERAAVATSPDAASVAKRPDKPLQEATKKHADRSVA
jgi:hypothetical protein